MAFVVNDRVKETTTDTGTTTIDLAGAETGFETFVAGIGSTNQTYYCIQAQGGSAFEIGVGTVTSGSPDTLSRTSVISSSNADGLVDFQSGTKDVFCTLPASKAVIEDNSTNADIAGNLTVGGTVDGVDIAARDGVLTSTTTTANAALPKAGGTMSGNLVLSGANITMSGSETVDGVDISARDTVLTNTTTTANAALPKAGGTMTGNISHASNFTLDMGGEITLDADGAVINLHDGGVSTGKFDLTNSDVTLAASVADKDIKFQGIDGSSTITALTLDMSSEGALVVNSNVKYPDNGKALFGAGSDLEIFHESSSGFNIIKDNSPGTTIRFLTDNLAVNNAADNKTLFVANDTNGVDLYFDNTKRAETTSTGFSVNGTLSATTLSGAISGNISQLTNDSGFITQVTSGGATTVSAGNGIGLNTGNGTITMSGSYTGSFSATGNITAYSSDERLKNFHGKIENALEKVDKLNGYYYEWNDLAKNIDKDAFKNGMEVGVSAQEIEKVLPEIVTEAPIVAAHNLDTDYKTVHYDKVVPLLIEAIKDLKTEVEELKSQIKELEENKADTFEYLLKKEQG
jgi:hypothetical protein